VLLQQIAALQRAVQHLLRLHAPVVGIGVLHDVTFVDVNPGEFQARRPGDQEGEIERGLARPGAAAPHPGIDLHQHPATSRRAPARRR
jgi:hypothetical protein